jgi:hypothetical protein
VFLGDHKQKIFQKSTGSIKTREKSFAEFFFPTLNDPVENSPILKGAIRRYKNKPVGSAKNCLI